MKLWYVFTLTFASSESISEDCHVKSVFDGRLRGGTCVVSLCTSPKYHDGKGNDGISSLPGSRQNYDNAVPRRTGMGIQQRDRTHACRSAQSAAN